MIKQLVAVAVLVTSCSPAMAQNCAPRDMVVDRLAEKYGESRQNIGLGQEGVMMETFANTDNGSWTITVTTPDGMTCLVASGQSYEALSEPSGDPA